MIGWRLEEAERSRRSESFGLYDDVLISATSCFSGMNSSAFLLSLFSFLPQSERFLKSDHFA